MELVLGHTDRGQRTYSGRTDRHGSRNSYLDVGMIVFCNVVLTLQYSREMKVQYEN